MHQHVEIPDMDGIRPRYGDDGSIFIPRRHTVLEQYLDKHFDRVGRQLRWFPRIDDCLPLADIKSSFKDQTCYIIGKGPSLDNLTKEHIGNGPVIAINEAIHKVESLDLPNQIFMIQQDPNLKQTCCPKKGTILIPSSIGHLYGKYSRLCAFTTAQLGLDGISPTVVVAIELAKLLGSNKFTLMCFDAYTQQRTDYAKCIGYSSDKHGKPNRFLRQAIIIKKHLLDVEHNFITPSIASSLFPKSHLDTPKINAALDTVFICFFTEGYEEVVRNLKKSLNEQGLTHDIEFVETKKGWINNVRYKPNFILQKMLRHKDAKAVVWVDADAVVNHYPSLLFNLDCDMAVHFCEGTELLSGTMYWSINVRALRAMKEWIVACKNCPGVWEQKVLQKMLEEGKLAYLKVHRLPTEYCKIFDKWEKQDKGRMILPIIEHFQHSRKVRSDKVLRESIDGGKK